VISSSRRLGAGTAVRTAASADGVAGTIRQESKSSPVKNNTLSPASCSGEIGFAICSVRANGEKAWASLTDTSARAARESVARGKLYSIPFP
jgi:hypothetical protein